MTKEEEIDLSVVRAELDEVSPCFCIAKWTQVTIHLPTGRTHSCHHPPVHKIPLSELTRNPSVLHNTPEKIKERRAMLNGERPAGCNYCWRVEDADPKNISDRIYKSSYPWSIQNKNEVLRDPFSETFIPRYVELNIGAACNFKCSYCSPEVSTKWRSEIIEHGAYTTSKHFNGIDPNVEFFDDDSNPYTEAWWKWWPDVYPHLHTFRITGGEPLINKKFYSTLDFILAQPNPNLVFAINTNLCPSESHWDKFLDQAKKICATGAVKKFELYTSAEAWGEKSDYIRFGMNFDLWRKRLWQLLEEVPSLIINIMATYNALSVTSYKRLLEEVLAIKSHGPFYNKRRLVPIFIDTSYLRYPEHQAIKILTPEFGKLISEQVKFMHENREQQVSEHKYQRGFLDFEIQKMERIDRWFNSDSDILDEPSKKRENRKDFVAFFKEHDRRRNTDFLKTFPELSGIWDEFSRL